MESWNLRMVWVGGTLNIIQSHPRHGQEHLALAQVGQSPVQPGLGHFRDGTLCQGLTILTGKNFY